MHARMSSASVAGTRPALRRRSIPRRGSQESKHPNTVTANRWLPEADCRIDNDPFEQLGSHRTILSRRIHGDAARCPRSRYSAKIHALLSTRCSPAIQCRGLPDSRNNLVVRSPGPSPSTPQSWPRPRDRHARAGARRARSRRVPAPNSRSRSSPEASPMMATRTTAPMNDASSPTGSGWPISAVLSTTPIYR
jgi:hypothetical protein